MVFEILSNTFETEFERVKEQNASIYSNINCKKKEQEINGLEIIYSCYFGLGFGSEFSVRSWRSSFRKSFGFTFEKNGINVIANHTGQTSSTHIRKGNHTNRTFGGK